ncbi:7-deoxyloganetic acid glucosyl transferase-like [Magnolia sinica]|uniref:7-deoxyloganetic acid glucosyl transferase-like n=1 Tax=Magnolia sinica TaxID=86752 RepID=UPI0026590DFE|nr:7-deoxyloganetic acid glucosyl transferase-like [Magnolia sinica]
MEKAPPHVLVFPFPIQGHINSMVKLANLLCIAGIHVTFLNTDHIHHLLLRSNSNLLARRPGLRFHSISDGLPPDHPRSAVKFMELYDSLRSVTKPLLRAMLAGSCGPPESDDKVTCIVADGILSFAIDVADELESRLLPTVRRARAASGLISVVPHFLQEESSHSKVSSWPRPKSFLCSGADWIFSTRG